MHLNSVTFAMAARWPSKQYNFSQNPRVLVPPLCAIFDQALCKSCVVACGAVSFSREEMVSLYQFSAIMLMFTTQIHKIAGGYDCEVKILSFFVI